jgi:hypothetical protein
MSGVIVIGVDGAKVGVRKLRAAGFDVTWLNPEKGGQLKDPEIRAADVIVLDHEHVESDMLRRAESIGTPKILVGTTDGVTWSMLRGVMVRAAIVRSGDGRKANKYDYAARCTTRC